MPWALFPQTQSVRAIGRIAADRNSEPLSSNPAVTVKNGRDRLVTARWRSLLCLNLSICPRREVGHPQRSCLALARGERIISTASLVLEQGYELLRSPHGCSAMRRHPLEAVLYEPLPPFKVAIMAISLAAGTILYCSLYNAFGGGSDGLLSEALWALVNVLPWYLALEAAKRARSGRASAAALGLALAASVLAQLLISAWPQSPLFALIRGLPGLLLVTALLVWRRHLLAALCRDRGAPCTAALPLKPTEVDWVAAAGNYVELKGRHGTLLHRAPLTQVQSVLEQHGFIRIHRSFLVRQDCIARVRRTDLVMKDGSSLPIGKRYRSALDQLSRPFVTRR